MAVNFSESKTKENLMRAFAGESQARSRYTVAAERAEKEGMYTIADMFRYTAEQERAHAERYYDLLKEFSGDNADLFLEEKELEAQQKAQEEREAAMRIPGMIKSSQLEDKDEDI